MIGKGAPTGSEITCTSIYWGKGFVWDSWVCYSAIAATTAVIVSHMELNDHFSFIISGVSSHTAWAASKARPPRWLDNAIAAETIATD